MPNYTRLQPTANGSGDDEVLYTGSALSWTSWPMSMKPTPSSYRLITVPVDGRALVVMVAVVETLWDRCGTSGLSTVRIRIRKRQPCHRTIWSTKKFIAVYHCSVIYINLHSPDTFIIPTMNNDKNSKVRHHSRKWSGIEISFRKRLETNQHNVLTRNSDENTECYAFVAKLEYTKAKAYNTCRAPQAATATSEALVISQAKPA